MIESRMTSGKLAAFFDELEEAIFGTAEKHKISDGETMVLLLGAMIHDFHVTGFGQLLRRYIDATLAELDAPANTEGDAAHLTQAALARHQASEALVLAIAQALAVDLETTVLPGHGPRPN